MFDQRALVFEGVTFAQMIELMVEMLVDLARSPILYQETAEHSKTTHPHHLSA